MIQSINHENQQEVIEVDDFVRQGDYKYMYSDSSMTAQKSEQADLVVQAVERFNNLIPLNLEEIFVWYFEQKGVDNPERFLGAGVNGGVNQGVGPEVLQGAANRINPEIGELPVDESPVETPDKSEILKALIPAMLEAAKSNKRDELLELIAAMKGKK